jgi:hypothetical protein
MMGRCYLKGIFVLLPLSMSGYIAVLKIDVLFS